MKESKHFPGWDEYLGVVSRDFESDTSHTYSVFVEPKVMRVAHHDGSRVTQRMELPISSMEEGVEKAEALFAKKPSPWKKTGDAYCREVKLGIYTKRIYAHINGHLEIPGMLLGWSQEAAMRLGDLLAEAIERFDKGEEA